MFNNKYAMRSMHFSQKITRDIESRNIEIIHTKTSILNAAQYQVLKRSLPASTIVTNTKKIKDMRNMGVEQVKKMLKQKSPASRMLPPYRAEPISTVCGGGGGGNSAAASGPGAGYVITDVFGKKYTNYFPVNAVCVYNRRASDNKLQFKKEEKTRIINSIMTNTERVKSEISSGKTTLIECKHKNFTKEFHQLRAADEAAHRVLTCNDCGRIFNVKS